MCHLYHQSVTIPAHGLDILEVDQIATMASHDAFGGECIGHVFQGVMEYEGLFFVTAKIMNHSIVVGGFNIEHIVSLGDEYQSVAFVVKAYNGFVISCSFFLSS